MKSTLKMVLKQVGLILNLYLFFTSIIGFLWFFFSDDPNNLSTLSYMIWTIITLTICLYFLVNFFELEFRLGIIGSFMFFLLIIAFSQEINNHSFLANYNSAYYRKTNDYYTKEYIIYTNRGLDSDEDIFYENPLMQTAIYPLKSIYFSGLLKMIKIENESVKVKCFIFWQSAHLEGFIPSENLQKRINFFFNFFCIIFNFHVIASSNINNSFLNFIF